MFEGRWVVRFDFRTDAIFKGSHDLPPSCVIFRIRRKHEHHIEWKAHRIALNLNVSFLHDVEQSDLDFSGKIREFIYGKDPSIRTRKKSVVDTELATYRMTA